VSVKRLEFLLVRTLEIVFCICFLIMFALIVTQVALRYGFNESIGGANELATILFGYTSALGIAVGIAKREHMAISWFTQRLPPTARKAVDVVGLMLLAAINVVIFWYSLKWIGVTGSRMISVLQVPRWTAQIAIPIGTGASAVFCLIKLFLGLKGDEELGVAWMQEE
jgi:TRAP-type C4-dicarboxylate transport system permease small subunit